MKKDCKRMAWLLLLMMMLSLTPAFAATTRFRNHQPNPSRYYCSPQAYYPGYYQRYGYECDYERYRTEDFMRKMYVISKMAEQNPDVQFNYSSSSAVFL